ncbi:hypothetical protein [Caballeronia arationis]|uniref:hypothetical protein n=1 Tax=Caballeronia arationis TaxID=1777142 RepID=UPI00117F29C6|nr:hypothetical protein [Caballeronia arationis]
MASRIRGTRNKSVTHLVDRMREKLERRNLRDFGISRVPREMRAAAEEYAAKHEVTLALAIEQLCLKEGADMLRLYRRLKRQSKSHRRRAKLKAKKQKSNDAGSSVTRYSVVTIFQGGAPGLGRRR